MIVYRFASSLYSHDISGEGARLYGGRWNSKGNPVLYTSMSISLALLELLIHSERYDDLKRHELVTIEIPNAYADKPGLRRLAANWQSDIDYCREIGDAFLANKKSLVLKVPSAIIPEEYNVIVNPAHAAFKKLIIRSVTKFKFDARMFKTE